MDTGALIGIIVGGLLAGLGYVGKLIVETVRDTRKDRAKKFARLVQLQALLRASRAAFRVQRELAGRLAERLREMYPESIPEGSGLERMFAGTHDRLEGEEAELHGILRAYTMHALLPINRALAKWLSDDFEFRTVRGGREADFYLAKLLNQLDAHLVLWFAKYEAWIPDRPDHALVYLDDEEKHGTGFPKGIEDAVDASVAAHWS